MSIDPNALINRQMQAAGKAPADPAPAPDNPVDQAVAATAPITDGQTPEPVGAVDPNEGMMNRYKDLNRRHAQVKAPMQIVEKMMAQAGEGGGDKVAQFLMEAIEAKMNGGKAQAAQADNPSLEREPEAAMPSSAVSIDDDIDTWALDNDINGAAPFKARFAAYDDKMNKLMDAMQVQARVTQDMMSAVGQQGATLAGKAGDQRQTEVDQSKRQIAQNLESAQAAHGLSDDDLEAFFLKAQELGYHPEEFVNPDNVDLIASTLVNQRKAAKTDRLEEQMSSRQAFTGSMGSTPSEGSAGAPPSADPASARINRIFETAKG